MLTSINIANALSTVVANIDGSFVTQDNAIFATGYSNGSAVVNFGTASVNADFAASGSVVYDTANNHIQVADGSYANCAENGINFALVAQGNAGGTLDLNGAGLSFTPDIGDGRLGISVAKDGATLDLSLDGAGTINVGTNGAISFGTVFVPIVTAPKDFSLNFAAKTYTGIPLAGNIHGDGVNDVQATLVNGTQIALTTNGFVGADLNFGGVPLDNVTLSGSIILDPLTSTLTFGQGSTLGVDLGTRHIDITATDNAGGQLTFGANGLTFKTAGGDGGLILSVTENGATRQALLNFAGEINYALDGSIRLAQGTVVNNVFADGNVLTITALTDASGSMVFDPNGGLTITPATPDALNVVLTRNGLDTVISSIDGTINYKGGIITASDGTTANLRVYDTWELKFSTAGGSASIQFIDNGTIYTAGEGSTFAVDYFNGTSTQIQNGSYADFYDEKIKDYVELISEGTTLRNNDAEVVFTLGTAGNYNLNGINVITTEDNLEVQLANYNTVIVGELAYTALNENSAIAISDAGVVGINEVSVNPISLLASADLAGDFLPNYETDFANALQIVDAGTVDNQLSEILPAENLGEVSFGTQADELSQTSQLVIAPDK